MAEENVESRGREAEEPTEIAAPGWRDILWRVWQQLGDDNVSIIAAGVAFYGLLAVFPAITAFVALYGLFADPATAEAQFAILRGVIPNDAFELLNAQVVAVASTSRGQLGVGAAVSLLLALWSGGAGVRALMSALNIAYREQERRGYVAFYGTALLFTIGILALGLLSLGVIVAVPVVLNLVQLGMVTEALVKVAPWMVLGAMVVLALGILYRFGASRSTPRTGWVSPGALLAAVLWLGASLLFSVYVSSFASYNETYGSLGAVIILLMWFWLSAYIVLLGAELNGEAELQTRKDTTTGEPEPMGRRGAYVADHVGEVP